MSNKKDVKRNERVTKKNEVIFVIFFDSYQNSKTVNVMRREKMISESRASLDDSS